MSFSRAQGIGSETSSSSVSSTGSSDVIMSMTGDDEEEEHVGETLERSVAGTTLGSTKAKSHSVGGSTLEQAANHLEARGYAGLTEYDPTIEFKTKGGVVSDATVSVPISKEMPSWSGYSKAPDAEKEEWDRFWNALDFHEEGHIQIIKEDATSGNGYANAHTLILEKTEDEAYETWKAILSKEETAQTAFEAQNDHGRTQSSPHGTTIIDVSVGKTEDDE
jgi:predicted secreted Zn-dependent protease